jgi:hypothetical protein
LQAVAHFEALNLTGAPLSEGGIDKMQKACPTVRIYF